MTIREAVHLVLQAAVIGSHGETLILDMGSPIKIVDLAQHMINRSGRDISVKFTGLRPGEKAHEILVSSTEEPKANLSRVNHQFTGQPIATSPVHPIFTRQIG